MEAVLSGFRTPAEAIKPRIFGNFSDFRDFLVKIRDFSEFQRLLGFFRFLEILKLALKVFSVC